MTDYFHRRNLPQTEYSGHEEISQYLRLRLAHVWGEYVAVSPSNYTLYRPALEHEVGLQFPGHSPATVFTKRDYGDIFTVVEIMLAHAHRLSSDREKALRKDLSEAFRLSGSVYEARSNRVELRVTKDLAEKLSDTQAILSPYQKSYQTFFNAVGDLVGRRKPTKDVIKDLFVGAEGYLKELTGENDFGDATKSLAKKGVLNPMQKSIMDKLYGYRSDADGVAHSGNTSAPGEVDSLWFLETLLAQINLVHRKTRGETSS
jgi:hypothetical protein